MKKLAKKYHGDCAIDGKRLLSFCIVQGDQISDFFSTKSNISQEVSIKHKLSIPFQKGLVKPDVFSRVFLSRSELTSKNGLEISKILGSTLNLPDALHIYLVNRLIKNEL